MVAVALELQHAVDEVLEHARPRHGSVLRHVADEDRGDAELLGHAKQPARRLANLAHGAGRGAEVLRVERLHRVDHADVRALPLERRADGVELGLREDLDAVGAAEPRRAELHLCGRLLAGDEERPAPRGRDRAERREEQRRLADARLAADQDEAGGNEPAAEDAVELRHAGRDPLRLLRRDVDELQQGSRRRPRRRGRSLLDERAEGVAAGALAEPAARGVAALGTRVLDCGLGHAATVAAPVDGIRNDFVTAAAGCPEAVRRSRADQLP